MEVTYKMSLLTANMKQCALMFITTMNRICFLYARVVMISGKYYCFIIEHVLNFWNLTVNTGATSHMFYFHYWTIYVLYSLLPCSHGSHVMYMSLTAFSCFVIIFSLEQMCFIYRNWHMRCVEDNFRSSLCAGCVFGCCCCRYIGCFHSWLCCSVLLGKSRLRLVYGLWNLWQETNFLLKYNV